MIPYNIRQQQLTAKNHLNTNRPPEPELGHRVYTALQLRVSVPLTFIHPYHSALSEKETDMDQTGVQTSVAAAPAKQAAHEEQTIPLNFAKPFTPFPLPYMAYDFSTVKWYWLPGTFALDIRLFLNIAIFITTILTIAVPIALSSSGKSNAVTPVLITLVVISAALIALRANIALNQIYRRAMCHSFFKSSEAKKIWESRLESEEIYAKDVYHTETNITGKIMVLRDGTIELRSTDDTAHQTEAIGNMMNNPETASTYIKTTTV